MGNHRSGSSVEEVVSRHYKIKFKMKITKEIIKDVKDIKKLVRENPEIVEYLNPIQKKIIQALIDKT